MTHKLYMVDNKPLISTEVGDFPTVTLLNYCKWYYIYVLHSDGVIEKVDSGLILDLNELIPVHGWVDHVFHPLLLLAVAEYYGGIVDTVALEAASGRWVMEDQTCSMMDYYLEDSVIEKIKQYKNKSTTN